jgi:hypothetical protein
MRTVRFTLYSRSYCHLCEDMLNALLALQAARFPALRFDVDVVDVDADPALVERFDELVPVLFGAGQPPDAPELCHYFLDPAAVDRYLAQSGVAA